MDVLQGSARAHLAGVLLIASVGVLCGGCTGHFSTHTDYLAPGFTRESLQGRTVAVIPPPGGSTTYENELTGIAKGMREFGARVAVLPPRDGAAVPDMLLQSAETAADRTGDTDRPVHSAGEAGSTGSYVLWVEITDASIYRAYAVPRDRGGAGRAAAAARTSGRHVGLRLTLLRRTDGVALWVATGKGEMWRSQTAAAPGAAPAAANVDDDIGGGNLPLYPPLPRADLLTRRLTRRLLAHVPSPPPLQPN